MEVCVDTFCSLWNPGAAGGYLGRRPSALRTLALVGLTPVQSLTVCRIAGRLHNLARPVFSAVKWYPLVRLWKEAKSWYM